MFKFKFRKLALVLSILILQPIVTPGSFAYAKRRAPMRAYSFIAEGGKASQGECDGEKQIPRRLKRIGEYAKATSYVGSELQNPEIKGKANEEMWKHIFKVKASCNAVLAKTPSAVEETKLKSGKPDIPPEESAESEDDADQPEQTEGQGAE